MCADILFFLFFFIGGRNDSLAASESSINTSSIIALPANYQTPLEVKYKSKLIQIRDNVQLSALDVNPSAPKTLIFIHGDSGSFDYWLPQINIFRDKYRIIAYDRSDCGRSAIKNHEPSYSNSAEDIALLVK